MSTLTARCTSWSTWTTSCSSANPKRSHVSTDQDVTATHRHLYNRQDSRLPWSTNHKQRRPIWNFTQRRLHQRHTTRSQPTQGDTSSYTRSNNFHVHTWTRGATRQVGTCPIQTLGRKATMAFIHTTWPELCSKGVGSLLAAAYILGQAASPTLPPIPGRYIKPQVCDTTNNTTYINQQGTTCPERVHGRRLGRSSRYTKEHNRFRDPILGYNSALWIRYTSSRSTLISREWVLRHRYRSNRSTTPQEFPGGNSYKQPQDTHGQLVR